MKTVGKMYIFQSYLPGPGNIGLVTMRQPEGGQGALLEIHIAAGVSYDYKSLDDHLLNSLTGKYYFYSMETKLRELTGSHKEIPVNLKKHYWGISNALRYRFTEELMGKVSAAYEVRTPTESELIGDGYLVAPSGDLLPERGMNMNIGAIWDKKVSHGMFQIEVNLFGN